MGAGRAKQEFDLPRFCRAVAEASPMPMAAVEEANYIVRYVNEAFCSLTGKPEAELIGNQFCSVVPAGGEFRALLDRVYRTGQAEIHTGQEHPVSHPSYWSYAMWPVLSPDGNPAGIVVQVTETTPAHRKATAMNQALMIGSVRQHQLTEEALWEGAERFRFMAESMPQKIFTAKPNGDVDYLNQQWTEFTGLSFDQIKDWSWTQFIHPDDLEASIRHWRAFPRYGRILSMHAPVPASRRRVPVASDPLMPCIAPMGRLRCGSAPAPMSMKQRKERKNCGGQMKI